jgi:hypothetical protein
VDEAAIRRYVAEALPGSVVVVASEGDGSPEIAWGDTFFFYDPDDAGESARMFPFATIVTKDYGEFDNASNLDRPGVFRLNISVGRETSGRLVGSAAAHDYTALDRLMPHPVYGAQHWISVLNPGESTFEAVKPVLAEAHTRAAARYRKSDPELNS